MSTCCAPANQGAVGLPQQLPGAEQLAHLGLSLQRAAQCLNGAETGLVGVAELGVKADLNADQVLREVGRGDALVVAAQAGVGAEQARVVGVGFQLQQAEQGQRQQGTGGQDAARVAAAQGDGAPHQAGAGGRSVGGRRIRAAPQPVQQQPQQSSNVPLVQNFNFAAPENSGAERPVNRSPLARIARSGQPDRRPPMNSGRAPGRQSANQPMKQPMRQPMNQPVGQYGKPSPLAKKRYQQLSQKPCVTEFCGLKKPNLNGLWVSQDGEMLGINNHRYLWSDGSSRYLTGQIKVQNEYLVTSVDDHDKLIRFKYKLAGNNLLTMQPDGTIREFKRMNRSQYQYFNSRGQTQNHSR